MSFHPSVLRRSRPTSSLDDGVARHNSWAHVGRVLTYAILLVVVYELFHLSFVFPNLERMCLDRIGPTRTVRFVRGQLERAVNLAQDVLVDWTAAEYASRRLEGLRSGSRDALDKAEQAFPGALTPLRANMNEILATLDKLISLPPSERRRTGRSLWDNSIVPARDAMQAELFKLTNTEQSSRRHAFSEKVSDFRTRVHVVLIGVILAFVNESIWNCRKRRRARERTEEETRQMQELERAQRDLNQLSGKLLSLQEDERKSLARELHDCLGQLLTAVKMEINAVQSCLKTDNEKHEAIDRAQLYISEAIKTVRDITSLLRPPLLDNLGLGAALRWQAEQFSQRTGIPCALIWLGRQTSLPESWNTCAYRITQEALHNCEKHARATCARISVTQELGTLSIDIEDNGRGFHPESETGRPSSGLGLLGMKERAKMLGGTLIIESSLGRGTRVRLRLPTAEMSLLEVEQGEKTSDA